ncbi:YhdT family protein [Cytobacillus massiliigabonensis]|uniref:YhdT family protein n=1 Tax=Cytobacillus massiliigabonensis TaxID=1871011 RepID=UPI000C835273|nr:YhdT family protein [Cytobacillus massiliigabonensis]
MNKNKQRKDPRFKVAVKEAWIGIGLVLFNFAWWFGFAYGPLGSGSVENYRYIFGLPAWFFYSCVAGFIVMAVLVILAVKLFFKDVSFDEDAEGEAETK